MDKQNVVYAYNGTLLCLIKRKGTVIHATTRMNLEDTVLSETSMSQKDLYHSTYEVPRAVKFIETGSRTMVNRGWEEGVWYGPFVFNGYGVSLWNN